MRIKLCSYDDLPDPGSKGICVSINNTERNVFIVKKNATIFLYENSCPHTLGPLDWQPDNFLDIDKDYILCANHGALFDIKNGFCIYGPCKSQSLQSLEHEIIDGEIYFVN